jgi:hypothetical protein
MIVYVERDQQQNIVGVYNNAQPARATEYISDTDPAVVSFLTALTKPAAISYAAFRALFTAPENQAIMTAALGNASLLDWVLQAAGAGEINLSDPKVKAGLDAIVAAGLLTADRETAILSGQPPPSG